MKTSELIALLQQRLATHGDLPVEVTWEGVFREIGPASVYKCKAPIEPYYRNKSEGPALVIDADGNYYKTKFAEDPAEGEATLHKGDGPSKG